VHDEERQGEPAERGAYLFDLTGRAKKSPRRRAEVHQRIVLVRLDNRRIARQGVGQSQVRDLDELGQRDQFRRDMQQRSRQGQAGELILVLLGKGQDALPCPELPSN
jgi:hypothetical protein